MSLGSSRTACARCEREREKERLPFLRPNVCYREDNATEPAATETGPEGDFYSTQCSNDGRVYRCLSRVGKNGTVHSRHGVYECCLGFRRRADEVGCTESECSRRPWKPDTGWDGSFLFRSKRWT